jgi:hypothetical protein
VQQCQGCTCLIDKLTNKQNYCYHGSLSVQTNPDAVAAAAHSDTETVPTTHNDTETVTTTHNVHSSFNYTRIKRALSSAIAIVC